MAVKKEVEKYLQFLAPARVRNIYYQLSEDWNLFAITLCLECIKATLISMPSKETGRLPLTRSDVIKNFSEFSIEEIIAEVSKVICERKSGLFSVFFPTTAINNVVFSFASRFALYNMGLSWDGYQRLDEQEQQEVAVFIAKACNLIGIELIIDNPKLLRV
jgi:hypothetical protein